MKKMISILFIVWVVITVNIPPQPTACPAPPPYIQKNDDGTYTKIYLQTTTLAVCYTKGESWQEEWSDYPENGGQFIRIIP